MAEKCKLYEIYRRMCEINGEACFSQKMFTDGPNCLKMVKNRPTRPKMVSTPEIVDSVNALVLAGKINHNGGHFWIIDLAFSKVSHHGVSPGWCKTAYCSKNSGNHQSVCLRTTTTSSLQSRSGPIWFLLIWSPQRISEWNKFFLWWRNEEHHDQMTKNSVQRFPCWNYTKASFFNGKMCFKKWRLHWKIKLKFLGEMWFIILQD